MSEKIGSVSYDDVNVPRRSSITFATVQIYGERAQYAVKKKLDHGEGKMGHGDRYYGPQ